MMRKALPIRYEKEGLAKLNNAINILETALPKTVSLMSHYETIASRVTFGFIQNTLLIKSLSQENQLKIRQAASFYMIPYSDKMTILSMLSKLKHYSRQLRKCAIRKKMIANSLLSCGM